MKKFIIIVCLSLIISSSVSLFRADIANAALQGRTSINSQITASNTPTLTGTLPTWCNDIVIGISTTQSDSIKFFFSDYGQVNVSNGNWSLNLASNSYGLVNGVYDIFIASECDYSGSYSDPLYADLHYGALSIVPGVCDELCVPVYRFYNTKNGAHFYTTSESEKRTVLDYPEYRFEGISSYAKQYRSAIPGMIPVYRFYNFKQGVHFYTANQYEASNVNNDQSSTYRYEGVSYYTYANQEYGTAPLYRFYKFSQGVHFYTSNQQEASTVNNTQSSTYKFEGVSYYNIVN